MLACDAIMDCLERAVQDEFLPRGAQLKTRLPATAAVLDQAYVVVARADMLGPRLHLNEDGAWSILAAVEDEVGCLVDVASFNLAGTRFATLLGQGFCLGLADLYDARWGGAPLAIHTHFMSWLTGGCRGVLPLDWPRTARVMHAYGVEGVVAASLREGHAIEARLGLALKPPRVVVRRETLAVAA